MSQVNWYQATIDLLQAIVSGVFVGLVVYWLDERRAKRERRLSDYRIASNWNATERNVSFRYFDLARANLSGHKFIQANMEGVILFDANLYATDFSEANLRRADFRKAMLVGVRFEKATVYDADFSWATIKRTDDSDQKDLLDFSDAIFKGVKFIGAKLKGIAMEEANLRNADFSRALVQDCDFTGADLTGSNWRKAKPVKNCVWKNVKVGGSENFPPDLWKEIERQNES
jgi:uncharacterized protein YjbI with pentapeptide repeats